MRSLLGRILIGRLKVVLTKCRPPHAYSHTPQQQVPYRPGLEHPQFIASPPALLKPRPAFDVNSERAGSTDQAGPAANIDLGATHKENHAVRLSIPHYAPEDAIMASVLSNESLARSADPGMATQASSTSSPSGASGLLVSIDRFNPCAARMRPSIALAMSGLSLMNCLAFSRP